MDRQEFAERLAPEVEAWRKEGLIRDEQEQPILQRYGSAAGAGRRARVAGVLAFLGALLLGIGVILLFASNWRGITGSVKLIAIFAAVAAAYGGGYWLRYERHDLRKTGTALLFLGALLYGAALFL